MGGSQEEREGGTAEGRERRKEERKEEGRQGKQKNGWKGRKKEGGKIKEFKIKKQRKVEKERLSFPFLPPEFLFVLEKYHYPPQMEIQLKR